MFIVEKVLNLWEKFFNQNFLIMNVKKTKEEIEETAKGLIEKKKLKESEREEFILFVEKNLNLPKPLLSFMKGGRVSSNVRSGATRKMNLNPLGLKKIKPLFQKPITEKEPNPHRNKPIKKYNSIEEIFSTFRISEKDSKKIMSFVKSNQNNSVAIEWNFSEMELRWVKRKYKISEKKFREVLRFITNKLIQ